MAYKPVLRQLTTREAQRIENKIKQRAVTGWRLIGGSYRNGRHIPGCVHLTLEGGGFLYYAENTPLDTALADADDRGFNTSDTRAKLAEWIATGKGATFRLE